jgi:hypothetical protein
MDDMSETAIKELLTLAAKACGYRTVQYCDHLGWQVVFQDGISSWGLTFPGAKTSYSSAKKRAASSTFTTTTVTKTQHAGWLA